VSETTFTNAKFWKCALQVNPAGYIDYRGGDHGMTEEEYNLELLNVALNNDIKIIGLADHGNVDGVDAIRDIMSANGILVFPGFEIASSEKIHFVCLYPEETTIAELHRYLGNLDLLDPKEGIRPSRLSAEQLLKKVVEDQHGFIFAAHCTGDSGLLSRKSNHVWQDPLLRAAQIPGGLDDLKNDEANSYRQIILNNNPDYKRDLPIGIINAKDVAVPGDLANPKASCLVKMTKPCFESFRLAFQDPKSRVRLNSEVSEKYYSRIEKLSVTGGYLDGVKIDFSEHLNSVIGGRGTGKSTLLECIRYALGLTPIGKNAKKQHEEIVKENLGKSKARVELVLRSSQMNGKSFTVARRYGESISVKDEDGALSSFSPADLLPGLEIYGQNEIYEIAQDSSNQRRLLSRFLGDDQQDQETKIRQALIELDTNRQDLIDNQEEVAEIEVEVAQLPKLEEQLEHFKKLGIEEKLKIVPLLESEKSLLSTVQEETEGLNKAIKSVEECIPNLDFLGDKELEKLPHVDPLRSIREVMSDLNAEANALIQKWGEKFTTATSRLEELARTVEEGIDHEEAELEKTFKDLPACEGKTGKQIGCEYQDLTKKIEKIRPKKTLVTQAQKVEGKLLKERNVILSDLSKARSERSAQFERSLKKLNRKLSGKLKLLVIPEADRTPVIDFLVKCQLEGVAEGRLAWIKTAEDFSPVMLAEFIRAGSDVLRDANWGVTPTVADAFTRLTPEQIYKFEEIELPDVISIELNTGHEGQENFRPLDKLSTGQQCTAILHLLLLQNLDPLIMDQPEDNLDNAFIADRIVDELRSAKISRQFIFATHNANIPVFGDAEWIGVFDASDGKAYMPAEVQGAIDVPHVRDKSAVILEGGKTAFNLRKSKYGF